MSRRARWISAILCALGVAAGGAALYGTWGASGLTPFGVPLGQPLPDGFVEQHHCEPLEPPYSIACPSAPYALGFKAFILHIYRGRVMRIRGITDYEYDRDGSQVRSGIDRLHEALNRRHGAGMMLDVILPNSPLAGEADYALSLHKKERHLQISWLRPAEGYGIVLEAGALSADQTTLALVFEDFQLFNAAHAEEEAGKANAL